MFFWTIVVFAISYAISSLLFTRLLPLLGTFLLPTISFLMTVLVATMGAATCFTIFLYYPKYVANNRGRTLEKNLIYVSNYMSIMANAGATVEQIFQSLG